MRSQRRLPDGAILTGALILVLLCAAAAGRQGLLPSVRVRDGQGVSEGCQRSVTLAVRAGASGPADAPRTEPTATQKKRGAAAFLGALIVLLLLFVAFVGVMVLLRNRLVLRRRPKRPPPTDATDLWSLAGQEEARRKAGKRPPEDRRS